MRNKIQIEKYILKGKIKNSKLTYFILIFQLFTPQKCQKTRRLKH